MAPSSVSVDVDDVLKYACIVSHYSQAAGGANEASDYSLSQDGTDSALVGAFPPHPHMDLLARSRLFSAAAGRPGADCRRIRATASPPTTHAAVPGGPPLVRRPPKRAREEDPAHFAEPLPAKRPFTIPALEECLRAAAATSSAPVGGDGPWWWSGAGDAADHALAAAVPARPPSWRPGDAVVVGPAHCAL